MLEGRAPKHQSGSNLQGYIYTFEIRDPDDNKTIQLKVRHAVNVVKRLHEWGKQCGLKEQVLRGFYPQSMGDGRDETSLMTGHAEFIHGLMTGLEWLIHLELVDLAVNAMYLQPGWKPFLKGKGEGLTWNIPNPVTSLKKSGGRIGDGNGRQGWPCKDCGTVHTEIFKFQRILSGPYKGREWDCVMKQVIEDWGAFVQIYM
ncbi:hypothetical protein IW261DRAFT_1552997 [Armillaria novae-zelandiae]|uniref:Uncharacterized protein n=1 Tax=Armillaria novae-zelandiae TaxID=153914 RepID=A0AA39NXB6_9AGAR|nr:hypothetical protein IW261DRAFT_1552997 [Armillaria novae-zelandiae]